MTSPAFTPAGLLEGLLRRYSPTHKEAPAVDFLAESMGALGFEVQVDAAGSVHGSLGSGPKEIVLLGHIDTVPGEISVRREGDLLFGRGAVDAKGPLACFTAAAAQAGAREGWKITVIGAVGEEGDSRGAQAVCEQYANYPPTCCVIGEPSGWQSLTLGYKGSAWVEYQVVRALTHTASGSESACDSALHFFNRLVEERDRYNVDRAGAFNQLATSLREMQSSGDGFSETARLLFNLRLPPGISPADARQMLNDLHGEGELRVVDSVPCYRAEKNTILVRAFLAAVRAQGGTPGFLLKTGTSDMNIVGPAWACPILAYGPGDSALDHTPNEHISLNELNSGVQVLTGALHNLQNG
jgi:LysW-gamma-L-lysine carboxypeptidase